MQTAEVAVYRLVVVVQNYEQVGLAAAGVVDAFEGEPAGECPVAYESHAL